MRFFLALCCVVFWGGAATGSPSVKEQKIISACMMSEIVSKDLCACFAMEASNFLSAPAQQALIAHLWAQNQPLTVATRGFSVHDLKRVEVFIQTHVLMAGKYK